MRRIALPEILARTVIAMPDLCIISGLLTKVFWHRSLGHSFTYELFYSGKFSLLFKVHQSVSGALGFSTRSAADAVHIIFAVVGHVKIDDEINIIDIDATA